MNDSTFISWLRSMAESGGWAGTVLAVAFVAFFLFLGGTVIRMILGKGADLSHALAGVLTVILVYVTQATAVGSLPGLADRLASLPFCVMSAVGFSFSPLSGLSDAGLYGGLVRLWLLTFLVDLLETFLPKGNKWRCVAVMLTLSVYSFLIALIEAGYPELFGSLAKTVIAVSWGLVLLIGLVKALLGVIQSSGNPLINFIHRFFYANPFGKLFPKSILTTVILLVLEALLIHLDVGMISLNLWIYIPVLGILLTFLYLFSRFL